MFRAKTILVVGAGASAEVDLPVGAKLLEEIVKLVDMKFDFGRQISGDNHFFDALRIAVKSIGADGVNSYTEAAGQLVASAGQALSIDNVIDALEDERIELVGKLGIVRAIHEAERQSRVNRGDEVVFGSPYLNRFKSTWYDRLTKLLTENVRKSEVERIFDNLVIINFNYDRCLEEYLPLSLASYYGLELQKTQELFSRLVMHRPYGVAGKLPWQPGSMPSVEFGGGHAQQTAAAAFQIKTFTERVEEGDELTRIKSAVAQAERIVFLGFAFHRQNVRLLSTDVPEEVDVLATAYGISASDRGAIGTELEHAFNGSTPGSRPQSRRVQIPAAKCVALFDEYWRTLTAESRSSA